MTDDKQLFAETMNYLTLESINQVLSKSSWSQEKREELIRFWLSGLSGDPMEVLFGHQAGSRLYEDTLKCLEGPKRR